MCYALEVERFVYVFKEREADDAVVCGFIFGDGARAEGGGAGESAIYSSGVEDLVDTEDMSVQSRYLRIEGLTRVSRRWV